MKKVKSTLTLFLSMAIVFSMIFMYFNTNVSQVSAATSPGVVKSASNSSNGITVNWTKASNKTGYYIYKKTGTASWKKVKTIKTLATTSWTDTNVSNGKKYTYKVATFKGSKVTSNKVTKVVYYLKKPTVTSTRNSDTSIKVKASNSSATGFQVRYSTSSKFGSYKTLTVKGQNLNQVISKLTTLKTYYVKVRAYKTVNGVNYYSAFSDSKNCTTYYNAYTTNVFTNFYEKADSNSKKVFTEVRYMAPIKVYNIEKQYPSGKFYKIQYNGKFCYIWVAAGTTKFTKTKNPYQYTGNTEYQQSLIDNSMDIFKNYKTRYDYSGTEPGKKDDKGYYTFDCSGFVSYCLNKTMQKSDPAYYVQKNILNLGNTTTILDDGYASEFGTTLVCKNAYDYNKLQPGDILFFKMTPSNKAAWDHCGIYLGKKQFVHSTQSAGPLGGVEVQPIDSIYAEKGVFVKALRFLPETELKSINETKYTLNEEGYYNTIYKAPNAIAENAVYKIYGKQSVTLLHTIHTVDSAKWEYAYIQYTDNGKTKYGYLPYDKKLGLDSKLSSTK